jgi:glycosyltransferase involved in cell wall biosynthesis
VNPAGTRSAEGAAAHARRLAVVLSHPIQYYSPWFRWLRTHTPIEFRVFYLWGFGVSVQRDPLFQAAFKWDVDLLSGYESEFVPNVAREPGTDHFSGLRNPQLTARLAAWKPDALLLFGYKWASHLRAIAWARWRGVPLVFRGDSHFLGRPAPGWHRLLPLRLLYRQFAAVTCVGSANRAYFQRLGVPAAKLFFAPHAVDESRFDPATPAYRSAAAELRGQLGLAPETRVVLYAGKLVPWKQPRELLEAFLSLAPRDAALVFVGDGEEKAALAARAADAPPGRVHFLPFANQTEMPSRYLLGDIFALPSRGLYETWGLAVNEAMHMGVPCLVSDRVGCQQDLVTDGETGWVFRACDPAHLREKLASALAADLPSFRPRVAARIAGYTYAQATTGLLAALASLPPPPR